MLKKLLVVLTILLACSCVYAQSVDELYQKNMKAHGGIDNINSVKTVSMDMKVSVMGMEIPSKMIREGKDKMRLETSAMGQNQVVVVNGDYGWVSGPQSMTLTKEQTKVIKGQDYTNFNLKDYKTRFTSVENLGKVSVDSIQAYKLKIITLDSNEITMYINADTYLEHKISMKGEQAGEEHEIEFIFKNFKDFYGWKYPTQISVSSDGNSMQSIEINNVEINKPVDPKMFEKPE